MGPRIKLSDRCFRWFLQHEIIYPSCWEDPRVDRAALRIQADDTVLVITSGGCNALAYALDEPRHIHAVDLNPRQNALLQLKLAGIRGLEFDDFFDFFGRGWSSSAARLYRTRLRPGLSGFARRYWDRHIDRFGQRARPFYYHGGIGIGAWLFKLYVQHLLRIQPELDRMFAAEDVDLQVAIYRRDIRDRFWTAPARRLLNNRMLLASAGIPSAQLAHANRFVPDVAEHLDRCAEGVLAKVPLRDNYFWQIYVYGAYTRDCCPDYLRSENFERLRAGLADRITVHTSTLSDFLRRQEVRISRFALLDHFDWYYDQPPHLLSDAWQRLLSRATPAARFLWRSMGRHTDFIDNCRVQVGHGCRPVGELLSYDRSLAERLREEERVNSYSSLVIADLCAKPGR